MSWLTCLEGGDCNLNGREDAEDVALQASLDCNRNGVPDECDLKPGVPGYEIVSYMDLRGSGDYNSVGAIWAR